jgi:hypothetical protein
LIRSTAACWSFDQPVGDRLLLIVAPLAVGGLHLIRCRPYRIKRIFNSYFWKPFPIIIDRVNDFIGQGGKR